MISQQQDLSARYRTSFNGESSNPKQKLFCEVSHNKCRKTVNQYKNLKQIPSMGKFEQGSHNWF